MTTAHSDDRGHARAILDAEIDQTCKEVYDLEAKLADWRTTLTKTETQLAAARARVAELQQARALACSTPAPITAADVQTADEGMAMRIGTLVLGVRVDATDDELRRHEEVMRAAYEQAQHQVRLATDELRRRQWRAEQIAQRGGVAPWPAPDTAGNHGAPQAAGATNGADQ